MTHLHRDHGSAHLAQQRRRARVRTYLTGALAVITLLTLIAPRWVEAATGWEPDGGSGALEWLIVGIAALATVLSAIRAQSAWRSYALARS